MRCPNETFDPTAPLEGALVYDRAYRRATVYRVRAASFTCCCVAMAAPQQAAVAESDVESLARRLAELPALRGVPPSIKADSAAERHAYLSSLLRRDAALFLGACSPRNASAFPRRCVKQPRLRGC